MAKELKQSAALLPSLWESSEGWGESASLANDATSLRLCRLPCGKAPPYRARATPLPSCGSAAVATIANNARLYGGEVNQRNRQTGVNRIPPH
ncbi:MAG TPA: hypothetical protein VLZ81_12995 [Blastocatellia bacterium]|nr:hypothetical protein [Blastocatellia bacterium]